MWCNWIERFQRFIWDGWRGRKCAICKTLLVGNDSHQSAIETFGEALSLFVVKG